MAIRAPIPFDKQLLRRVEEKQKAIKTGRPVELQWGKGYELDEHAMDQRYYYHLAIRAFKNKVIDGIVISRLRKGAKMLSVGTGPGHLEKTLLRFGIPIENIHVADIETHPRLDQYPFKKYVFDMRENWPDFKEKYDYIIFPDSLGSATWDHLNYGYNQDQILKVLISAYNTLNHNDEIRIPGTFGGTDHRIKIMLEKYLPNVEVEYEYASDRMIIRKLD